MDHNVFTSSHIVMIEDTPYLITTTTEIRPIQQPVPSQPQQQEAHEQED